MYEKIGFILLLILSSILYSLYDTNCLIALCIIRIMHCLMILFILLGPFIFTSKLYLQFYLMISAFMLFHWIISNDTCALTLVEQLITGRKSEETFIGKIVKPVYNVTNKQITIIALILFIFAGVKYTYLYCDFIK